MQGDKERCRLSLSHPQQGFKFQSPCLQVHIEGWPVRARKNTRSIHPEKGIMWKEGGETTAGGGGGEGRGGDALISAHTQPGITSDPLLDVVKSAPCGNSNSNSNNIAVSHSLLLSSAGGSWPKEGFCGFFFHAYMYCKKGESI